MNVIEKLSELRTSEHSCTVQIIEALVVCYRERAFLPLGYSCMWDYLTGELRYSPAAASRRYKAMKCALKFPQVCDMLREHRVTLSSLARAEALLDGAVDAAVLLDRIDGKPAVEVEKIVARARPAKRKPREAVRRVAVQAEPDPLFDTAEPMQSRVSVRTTLTEERFEAFERARAIISRKHSNASVEDVLNELVDHFLKSKAPKPRPQPRPGREPKPKHQPRPEREPKPKHQPRPERKPGPEHQANPNPDPTPDPEPKRALPAGPSTGRHIPAAVRDEVLLRDHEQCQFVGATGHRCGSTHNLQIDHIEPWATGGSHDPGNLRVLCAAHNRHRAREQFGSPPPRRS